MSAVAVVTTCASPACVGTDGTAVGSARGSVSGVPVAVLRPSTENIHLLCLVTTMATDTGHVASVRVATGVATGGTR